MYKLNKDKILEILKIIQKLEDIDVIKMAIESLIEELEEK